MPRGIIYAVLILAALSFIPLAMIARARVSDSRSPRIQVIPDMDSQPKYKAQQPNPLFADGRAMRPPVSGSVAQGGLNEDPAFFAGRAGDNWVTRSPLLLNRTLMARGQQRYDIFCATCHGIGGVGDGMISRRAERLQEGTWIPPTDLTGEVVRGRPDGHIYNTITYGIRNMPAYGAQIVPEDRWAIVAYVRALQRSRNASLADVPEEIRPSLR